ncbi:MAG TPA: SdrD B-like domain-containing protein [Humisphaera sp.]|jgi:hypothetical protein|nr:SdrD B-like domain-containing protein [Humisphaera sp.]
MNSHFGGSFQRAKRQRHLQSVQALENRAFLSAVVVNTVLDGLFPPNTGIVSLRNAIATANASTSPTTVTFDPSVFAARQTIVLNGSQLELSNTAWPTTVTCPSAGVTVSGNNASRVFLIDTNVVVNISGITITQGKSQSNGGGISNNGTLSLSNSVLTGNSYVGQTGGFVGGGAIANTGALSLYNDTVSANTSTFNGGGIDILSGTGNVANVTFSANSSSADGAAIANNGTVALVNVTMFGNSNFADGGGIANFGKASLFNNTVVGNTVAGGKGGGGIANFNTSAGTFAVVNSVVAGNRITGGPSLAPDAYGQFTSSGSNLVSEIDGSGGWTATDRTGTQFQPYDAKLGPLSSNGGSTQTLLPLSGSPAIDHGSNASIPAGITSDQRGFPRLANGIVDIGAVEYQIPNAPTGVTAIPTSGQITLNWNAVANAASYSIYRGTAPGAELPTPIATGLTNPNFNDAPLTNGQIYYYFVTASDAEGESPHSDEVSATAGVPVTATGASLILMIDADGHRLDVTTDGTTNKYFLSQIGAITINGANTGSTLTIDETGGAVPSLRYVGGAGTDQVNILGAGAGDSLALAGSSITFGPATFSLQNVEGVTYTDNGGNNTVSMAGSIPLTLNMGIGSDTLTVAAGSNAIVNFGASNGDLTINGNGNTLLIIGTGNPTIVFASDKSGGGSTGSIAGTVFNDTNANGRQDSGEAGIVGRRVFLDLNRNGRLDANEPHVVTAADGSYQFTGLAAMDYLVRETTVGGWRPTTVTSYGVSLSAAQVPSTGLGQAIVNRNFGTTNLSRISGFVFNDKNANGKRDAGEAALANRVVYIDANNNGKLDAGERRALSAADGRFSFDGLSAGNYVIREVAPAGWANVAGEDRISVKLKPAVVSSALALGQRKNGQ